MGPDTSASLSCSTSLNGELFVFGGHKGSTSNQSIQISKIVNCELKRIGDLGLANKPGFEYGACGTFLFDGVERVMLCFPLNDKKKCIR